MPTPQEIESAAGIEPRDEVERKRIWAAAQSLASTRAAAPSAEDLRTAQAMLEAARAATDEHLSEGRGRAIITLTDADTSGEEFEVSVEFIPEPRELNDEEFEGTPAQAVAVQLLDSLLGGGEEHDGHHHH